VGFDFGEQKDACQGAWEFNFLGWW
jgi:hypothetical protein